MNIKIRPEHTEDYPVTEILIKKAFENSEMSDNKEHELVSRIRVSHAFVPELSLVAVNEDSNQIAGHILLSKIIIKNDHEITHSLALAPVSVLPDFQLQGIGKFLIQESIKKAKELGFRSIIVLGHPEYYPKFGFKKASQWGKKTAF